MNQSKIMRVLSQGLTFETSHVCDGTTPLANAL